MNGDLIFTGTPSGVGTITQGDKLEMGLGKKSFMKIDVIDYVSMRDELKSYSLYVDGAADLHSKTAGIGGVFYNNADEEIYRFSEYLDDATNNEAEYTALIEGLKYGLELKLININIYSDSELVVKQISGHYKVKNDRMKKLYKETYSLLSKFKSWSCTHVLRDKNKVADKLATDGRLKGK